MNRKLNNYRVLAENLYLEGNLKKSVSLYKKALEKAKSVDEKVLMLFNLGVIYTELHDWNTAINYYKKILEMDPNYSHAYYQLGVLYEDLNDLEAAKSYYQKAIGICKIDNLSLYNLANILDRQGDLDQAISLYYQILKTDPNHSYALNNLGAIYEQSEDFDLALDLLKKSIENHPNYYLSHFNMGVVYFAFGDKNKAIYHYNIAKDLNLNYEYVYLNLSALFLDDKKYNEALDVLTEGILYNSKAHDLYYNRACTYSIIGHGENALDDLEVALELHPGLIDYLILDDDFVELRDKKRYIEIIKKYS